VAKAKETVISILKMTMTTISNENVACVISISMKTAKYRRNNQPSKRHQYRNGDIENSDNYGVNGESGNIEISMAGWKYQSGHVRNMYLPAPCGAISLSRRHLSWLGSNSASYAGSSISEETSLIINGAQRQLISYGCSRLSQLNRQLINQHQRQASAVMAQSAAKLNGK